ncbi:RESISTANCE PROTEIN RGA2 putative-RELATED [Salix purpurea]|uniref:RESISTANCE PROTEIN RGA2 putative-RELATED n=1 Tax=Salix purpurea TaxID=77065 RepID=A0A9Q0VW40_SALPP|nr:RESISTANCE PROTEIN RGA2 putative-RELATED [Salix purpurea]
MTHSHRQNSYFFDFVDWWQMAIESVGGSLVSKIAELLAGPVIKQFCYMFCFNNFVQQFNEQMMSLALALYRLQDAVDVAERNAEEIEIDVSKWLEDAKNEMEGLCDEDFNLNTMAKKVARECQGLPIALVTVGRALRDKSTDEWEQASKDLKNSQFQHAELIEDYNIPIEDLTRYVVGYGLHQDVESIEDARKELKVLLLELDYNLNVPERFFEGMKEIKVLSLKGGCLSLQSLEFSTNLQSLLLIECECKDLIWLRKLQRLEILGFIGWISVKELPDEMGDLKELRLLDVTGCYSLKRIPMNLIGRLKKLEELLINTALLGWDVVGCDSTGGMNASLTELNSLSHLAVLSLKIPRIECIPRDFIFPRLLKYDIVLGDGYSRTEHPTSTRLYLRDINATSLYAKTFEQLFPTVTQIGFKNVEGLENIALSYDQITSHGHGSQKDFLQRLEDVKVKGCRDTRTLFPSKWRQALNNLKSVVIKDCESLEEVFELGEADEGNMEVKELRLLSSLTRLVLGRLPELKCIWKGPTRHVSLRSLIHLELWFLDKLTFIFTPSLAQSLVHLETLRIDYCSGLKHLIREKDDEREIIPETLGFPKLKTLSLNGCDKLEYVFPISVSPSLLNLEEMKIVFGANLKQIFYNGEGDALNKDGIINFPSLQVLTIEGHEELGYLFAQLQGHTNLREIHITVCKGAQELMQVGSFVTNGRTGHELSLLSLEKLDLSFLPDMRCIWKGLVLSHLTTLEVHDCEKLTHVFTGSMVASLVQLQFLVISACEELEQIIAKDNDDEKDQILSGSDLQSLCLPNLCRVFIMGCNKLRSLFPEAMALGLPKLETLEVRNSSQLLRVFGQDDYASHVNVEKQMVFPNLSFLCLYNLPSIVCFSHGCDDFLFPRLGNPMVDECPKLTTQFVQSKVSQSS